MNKGTENQPAAPTGLPPTLAAKIAELCASREVAFEDKPRFSTERAALALAAFSEVHGGEDDRELLRDLLSDLMHFADSRGIEFDDELETARANYDDELE